MRMCTSTRLQFVCAQWLVTINAISGYVGQDRVAPLVSVPSASASAPIDQSPSPSRTRTPRAASPRASRSISEASASEQQHSHSLAAEGGSRVDDGAAEADIAIASRAWLSWKAFGFFGGLLKGTTSASKVCFARALQLRVKCPQMSYCQWEMKPIPLM